MSFAHILLFKAGLVTKVSVTGRAMRSAGQKLGEMNDYKQIEVK